MKKIIALLMLCMTPLAFANTALEERVGDLEIDVKLIKRQLADLDQGSDRCVGIQLHSQVSVDCVQTAKDNNGYASESLLLQWAAMCRTQISRPSCNLISHSPNATCTNLLAKLNGYSANPTLKKFSDACRDETYLCK